MKLKQGEVTTKNVGGRPTKKAKLENVKMPEKIDFKSIFGEVNEANMETIQHIVLPLIIISILLYIVWNLLRKVEKLEDSIEEQDEVLDSVEASVQKALDRMKTLDRLGSFEADDESGFVFREIQSALDKLNNEINPNAQKEKKKE